MSSKKREVGECIYCGFNGPMSDEHGWPCFFGEFEEFPNLPRHVCEDCNNQLGKLEDQFSHAGEIAFFRRLLGIEGRKSHDKVDPFVRGSEGAAPLRLLVLDRRSGLQLLVTVEPGFDGYSIRTHTIDQLVIVDSSGAVTQMPLRDQAYALDELTGVIERAQVPKPARVYWLVRGARKETMRAVTCSDTSGLRWEELGEPDPRTQQGAEIGSSIAEDRFAIDRAIAKIALTYLIASSADCITGLEPYLHDVKDYIRNGGDDSQFVTMRWEPILQMPAHYGPTSWYHLATADYRGGLLFVSLQFFCGPQYPHPPRYDVALALTYDVTPDFSRHGHQFVYGNCEKGTGGYVGRAEPLHTSIPPGLDAGVCD